MTRLTFTEEEQQALHQERFEHSPPRVQQRMEVPWLIRQGIEYSPAARLAGGFRGNGGPPGGTLSSRRSGGLAGIEVGFRRQRTAGPSRYLCSFAAVRDASVTACWGPGTRRRLNGSASRRTPPCPPKPCASYCGRSRPWRSAGTDPLGAGQRPLSALRPGDGLGQDLEHPPGVSPGVFAQSELD